MHNFYAMCVSLACGAASAESGVQAGFPCGKAFMHGNWQASSQNLAAGTKKKFFGWKIYEYVKCDKVCKVFLSLL